MSIPTASVKVDTSAIKAAGETASKIMQDGNHLNSHLQLKNYKMKTMPIMGRRRDLSSEDRESVIKLVQHMNTHGWLNADDILWCRENNIPV